MVDSTVSDANGVTAVAIVEDGRIKLEFSDKGGGSHTVFVPADTIFHLAASLLAINDKAGAAGWKVDVLDVHYVSGGFAGDPPSAVLALKVLNDRRLCIRLSADLAEVLIVMLAADLERHGRLVSLRPPGQMH